MWSRQAGEAPGRPGTLAQLAGPGTQRAIVEHVLIEERLWPGRIWAGAFLLSWGHAPFEGNGDREMSGLRGLLQDILILKPGDTRSCSVFWQERNSGTPGPWSPGHNFLQSTVPGLSLFPTNHGDYCHQTNCSPQEIMKDRETGDEPEAPWRLFPSKLDK